MKTFTVLLMLAAGAGAAAMEDDPARQLFDSAIQAESEGKLDVARTILLTVAATFPGNPLAVRAKDELGAIELYLEGQERLQAGSPRAAFITFRTVAQVYPESHMAGRAEAAGRAAQQEEPEARAPIVRSIVFKGVASSGIADIIERFAERETRLAVERPFHPQDLEEAKKVLEEFLAERGQPGERVKAEARAVPPHSVEVTFTKLSWLQGALRAARLRRN